jgi:hypothetical protein
MLEERWTLTNGRHKGVWSYPLDIPFRCELSSFEDV